MSAATVCALALIALTVFFIIESRPHKKTLSILDLTEFKDLPGELRAMIRSVMPNSAQLKKQWAHMTPQQKQMVMQQISSQMPKQPQQPQQDNRAPAPSFVIKPETRQIPEAQSVFVKPETMKSSEAPSLGLKSGFLLSNRINKSKKKNTKDKKHDEVVTLSDVGASEDEETIVSTDITHTDSDA